MYAKNRTHCACVEVTGPYVCEKPNTLCFPGRKKIISLDAAHV